MASYAVGDIQGCLAALESLLKQVGFSEDDCLWVAGDLVNRGPQSLETLRFIKALGDQAKVVLGNHDLHLLALHTKNAQLEPNDTLQPIFEAHDREALLTWLQQQPLLHYDAQLDTVMTHAGIPPCWDLRQAQKLSQELRTLLQSKTAPLFFANMYGNQPDLWHDNLEGIDRWRCITNSFTRMRFITSASQLDFVQTGKAYVGADALQTELMPWFNVPSLVTSRQVFGHWAALRGETGKDHVVNLDMGCVWGGHLKLMRLEDGQCFTVSCQKA
ncbi:MAG: symmetrical bis(5'-nucleosyl)-tetraphosphatase [Oceanospirillaceae bacterium]|nr:symmetrical bis(5'-nucleosyl)-tetraphosphatase [Pseudomonadales bacterium]